jgi:hypothetical protein
MSAPIRSSSRAAIHLNHLDGLHSSHIASLRCGPGQRFFDGQDSKFRCKLNATNLDSSPSNLYYQNDHVSFPNLLPVLYLLLYACVHWRREAADLRIF